MKNTDGENGIVWGGYRKNRSELVKWEFREENVNPRE